jgi:hypothetical protein
MESNKVCNVEMNTYVNDILNTITAEYLENVVKLFKKEYVVSDTDWQVVYDVKAEILEKYLPMLGIEFKE